MQDGHVSAISTEAEVVYQKWDSVNDCPTLELDGKRFIVIGILQVNTDIFFWLSQMEHG